MRPFVHLPVIGIFSGLLLIAGCSGSDGPAALQDEASRLVAAKAEVQRLQCECAVQTGAYVNVAACEADLFKLEPAGDAQCLRDVFAANPVDVPAVDCELSELEGLASCIAAANCDENASDVCFDGLDQRLNACPKGPATSGDTFTIAAANGASIPIPGGLILNMPGAKVAFEDEDFYPSNLLSELPTFTNDDADFLNDDVDRLSGGNLTSTDGTIEYSFDITDFMVAIDPIETFKYNYTATGTLTNTLGGDAFNLNGAPFFITVKHDIKIAPDSTSEASAIRQAQWSVMADYWFGAPPFVPGSIRASAPTQLLATDSSFDALVDSCQNLPGDQLALILGSSVDDNFGQLCRCAPDDAARVQCLLGKDNVSPRNDCLAQLVDQDPLAAEVTECIIEELDFDTDSMTGRVCCAANPGDPDCLNSGGALDVAQSFRRCTPSDAARDVAEAVLFCMGPPPPPPPPPVDFSSDPARCDNTTNLASGVPGDFMVITRSRLLDGNGIPHPRHYVIFDLTQLSSLATLDAAQPLVTALYGLDAGSIKAVTDQCELPDIVSIALDGDGTPPNFGSINGRISDVQNGLNDLPTFIAQGRARAEEYARRLYKQIVCPAVSTVVGTLSLPAPGGNVAAQFVADAVNAMIKQAILGSFGCLE